MKDEPSKTITGRDADLTGLDVEGYCFTDCRLTLAKDPPSRIVNNLFEGCTFIGDGWPRDQFPTPIDRFNLTYADAPKIGPLKLGVARYLVNQTFEG